MNKQNLTHISWRSALSALVIVLGTFGMGESPAEAYPHQIEDNLKNSLQLAQIRGRGRIKTPTPLNLRPRTHIPLPSRRYHQRSDYYEHYYRGSRRGHRQYRGANDHGRYDHDHHDHRTHRRRNRSRRKPVIIIDPANSSRHRNYNNYDGFIRLIHK